MFLFCLWGPSSDPLPPSCQEREHNSEDEDEDKYADDIDMPGQNFDSKRRITVRNLRIREDIAKVSWAMGRSHDDDLHLVI